MLVEVCANSLESALNAEKAGADRIELCSELAVGGITPSYGFLHAVSEKISIPVRVLIRPRSGNFTYSDDELEIMIRDIKSCVELGFDGVVSGVLNTNFLINEKDNLRLIKAAGNLKFTFHRAFDWVLDPIRAVKLLEEYGVDTILTSGQQKNAITGIDLLSDLHVLGASTIIMPGSGINSSNAHLFKEKGFEAIHLSGTKMVKQFEVNSKVGMSSPAMLSDDSVLISHFETIQEIVKAVK